VHATSRGFFGKIPARGDFVRAGLPNGFITAWDDWLQSVIPVSRDALGEEWLPAWLEAPIWRFALARGVCGSDAVLGLWMPSMDRAGRHFPLTLAATVPDAGIETLARNGAEWLAEAERAGLDAVMCDLAPDRLAGALALVPAPPTGGSSGGVDSGITDAGASRWWTEGAPRVAPRTFEILGLPNGIAFAGMLDDRIRGAP
jgi:type VI secretion system protein ImpM